MSRFKTDVGVLGSHFHLLTFNRGGVLQPHVCLFVAVAFIANISADANDEDALTDHSILEAASLLEAFAANLESIHSVDVAIEKSTMRHEEKMSAFEEQIVRERLVVDEHQELGLRAQFFETRRFRPGEDSEPLITKVIADKRVGNRAGQRYFPRSADWVNLSDEKTFA